MKDQGFHYDIIGDIHGRYDKLEGLLDRLGYQKHGAGYKAPAGRKALFLGDLIDPKPGHAIPEGVRRTLHAVKAMCDDGQALCLMGNHEFNAMAFHTRGPDGAPLRRHDRNNVLMHQGTLDDFPDHQDPASEWRSVWLPWLSGLPLYLDLGALRAVHACWHPEGIGRLQEIDLRKVDDLTEASDESTTTGAAVKAVLKGIEVPLPKGVSYQDHVGEKRCKFRARWWERPDTGVTYRQLSFPDSDDIPDTPLKKDSLDFTQPHAEDAPPVFFGHYLKPADSPLLPERDNVACLDHGAAKDGPLVAYRWHGEATLTPDHYVAQV